MNDRFLLGCVCGYVWKALSFVLPNKEWWKCWADQLTHSRYNKRICIPNVVGSGCLTHLQCSVRVQYSPILLLILLLVLLLLLQVLSKFFSMPGVTGVTTMVAMTGGGAGVVAVVDSNAVFVTLCGDIVVVKSSLLSTSMECRCSKLSKTTASCAPPPPSPPSPSCILWVSILSNILLKICWASRHCKRNSATVQNFEKQSEHIFWGRPSLQDICGKEQLCYLFLFKVKKKEATLIFQLLRTMCIRSVSGFQCWTLNKSSHCVVLSKSHLAQVRHVSMMMIFFLLNFWFLKILKIVYFLLVFYLYFFPNIQSTVHTHNQAQNIFL